MFENFGLKDIWSNIKKFKLLLIIVLLAAIVYSVIVFNNNKNKDIMTGDSYFISSAFYDVRTNVDNENMNLIAQRNASTYKIMSSSDVADSQVLEKLLADYSKEEIIKFCGLSILPDALLPSSLDSIFTCNMLENTNTLNLFVKAKDETFTNIVLEYYKDYLVSELQPMIESDSLEYLGGAQQKVKSEIAQQTVVSNKTVILIVLATIVLELLCVILYSFFHPTVNAKTDFQKYGVKVLAKLS